MEILILILNSLLLRCVLRHELRRCLPKILNTSLNCNMNFLETLHLFFYGVRGVSQIIIFWILALSVWYLEWFFDFQYLSFWFLSFFDFQNLFVWFLKCFWFPNLSVWFLESGPCVIRPFDFQLKSKITFCFSILYLSICTILFGNKN